MVQQKVQDLAKILSEMSKSKKNHTKWLKEYPSRGVDMQYLSEHIAAGQSLAASALTALFLTEKVDNVRALLYNIDEGTESSRNFPFYYCHLLLIDLLFAWNKENLFEQKSFVIEDCETMIKALSIFLEALACSNDRVAKKLSFFQYDKVDALFERLK